MWVNCSCLFAEQNAASATSACDLKQALVQEVSRMLLLIAMFGKGVLVQVPGVFT